MLRYFLVLAWLACAGYLQAQVFDFVVAADGSGTHTTVQSAIDACPDGVHKNIFVKAGTYREKVYIGSHTVVSNKQISLIGEDALKTIIVWDDYNGKSIYYYGSSSATVSGTPQSATFTVNAVDFYAENITIKNEFLTKQAVALYNVADRQSFKNCRLVGYQDTHYLKKGRRSYFQDCYIEGGTDYVCAGGTAIFEGCQLKSLGNGSYISAPEDITAYTSVNGKLYYHGFVFRNCTLNSSSGVVVYLGRPWQATSSSVYLNCKMENIKPEGWSVWSGTNHLTSFFAEYNSMDLSGNTLDVSSRVSWSYQLTKDEVDAYYSNAMIYSHITTTAYEPVGVVTALGVPLNTRAVGSELQWDLVDGAIGYVIIRNGSVLGFSAANSFVDNTIAISGDYTYTVKSVKSTGNLSIASAPVVLSLSPTAVSSNLMDKPVVSVSNKVLVVSIASDLSFYSLRGELLVNQANVKSIDLNHLPSGIYLVKAMTANGKSFISKVKI
jgi:pectin methylesterase-like acyl-CoA thioesterase